MDVERGGKENVKKLGGGKAHAVQARQHKKRNALR